MKKLFKILGAVGVIGAGVAGGLFLYNKFKSKDEIDEFDDDYDDDFSDDEDEDFEDGNYVDLDDVTVASEAAEEAAEAVEEVKEEA